MGAWDRWHAGKAAAEDASGETAAAEHYRAVCDEHDAFLLRLVGLRTADPDVMRVKAAAVLDTWRGDPGGFDHTVERAVGDIGEDGSPEDALCFSLMRDVLHRLGPAFRVAA